MTVYVLRTQYEGVVLGVFSTAEGAEAHRVLWAEEWGDALVEPHEVDEKTTWTRREVHVVTINATNPELRIYSQRTLLLPPGEQTNVQTPWAPLHPMSKIEAWSTRSREVAELLAEAHIGEPGR